MNKKIKIIELFQKYANNEELPKKIKYDNTVFYLQENNVYGAGTLGIDRLLDHIYNDFSNINNEVEILEDNTEEIEELEYEESKMYCDTQLIESTKTAKQEDIIDKINELVKAVNSIRKDLNK